MSNKSNNSPRAKVLGYCPMGCGQTLFLGAGGYVTCSLLDCPKPEAASIILAEDEHEHIVDLTPYNFTIRHPLRERIDDKLLKCELHHYLINSDEPPQEPGRYRVCADNESWSFTSLSIPTNGT